MSGDLGVIMPNGALRIEGRLKDLIIRGGHNIYPTHVEALALRHPDVQKAIDEAIRRIIQCGKAAGILTPDEKLARHYIELGASFVAVGVDITMLARETEKLAAKFKKA